MRPIGQVLTSTRQLWPYYAGIILCSVLTASLTLATPFLVKAATDLVVGALRSGSTAGLATQVAWLAFALLMAELVGGIVFNIGGYLGDTMAAKMRDILSTRYYAKLLGLPQRYFDDEITGTIINRLNRSITEISQFLQSFSNNFSPMLVTVAAVLAVSAWYYWPLTVLLAIVFPAYFWLTTLTSTKWQRLEGEKNTEIDLASGRFAEAIGQIRVVKSFVAERRELSLFSRRFAHTIDLTREQSRYWHGMDGLRRAVLAVVFAGIYAILFVRTAQGHMSIGDMVLLIQLVGLARTPVTMMSYLVDITQRAVAGSRSYFAVMAEIPEAGERMLDLVADRERSGVPVAPAEPVDPSIGRLTDAVAALAPGDPLLEFDGVSFAYESGHPVLTDISFSIAKGQRVALVSESGGGKTTLVNLLLGFYRVSAGRIRLAGYDITDVPTVRLRSLVGVVFQDASLFSGTIAENVRYGSPDAPEDQVRTAAQRANADVFVRGFDQGYDTLIGERGLKLSGGQKQRVAVARAILKDAPILVLDEATSALDTKAERLVQQGLDELMTDRTSLIIAHRLSTISAVDVIVTLSGGRIQEIGAPADLARTGGIYAELLLLQASASQADRRRLREYGITG